MIRLNGSRNVPSTFSPLEHSRIFMQSPFEQRTSVPHTSGEIIRDRAQKTGVAFIAGDTWEKPAL